MQGAVAQYGRGVVGDVAAQLTKRFAECVAQQLGDEPPAPAQATPVGGLRLALGAFWRAFVRLFRRR